MTETITIINRANCKFEMEIASNMKAKEVIEKYIEKFPRFKYHSYQLCVSVGKNEILQDDDIVTNKGNRFLIQKKPMKKNQENPQNSQIPQNYPNAQTYHPSPPTQPNSQYQANVQNLQDEQDQKDVEIPLNSPDQSNQNNLSDLSDQSDQNYLE